MKKFKKFIIENKNYFVGHCQNSFDEDGDCVAPHLPYRDTTDFAQGEENAAKIHKDEFEKRVSIPDHLQKLHNSKHVEHMHDKDNGVHMMYDKKKDIHHFFTKVKA